MRKIKIENEITANTLAKIYLTQEWWQKILDEESDMNQFLENVENWYITEKSLKIIIQDIFADKKGGFRKTLECFGTRNKKRFIKQKLQELLETGATYED